VIIWGVIMDNVNIFCHGIVDDTDPKCVYVGFVLCDGEKIVKSDSSVYELNSDAKEYHAIMAAVLAASEYLNMFDLYERKNETEVICTWVEINTTNIAVSELISLRNPHEDAGFFYGDDLMKVLFGDLDESIFVNHGVPYYGNHENIKRPYMKLAHDLTMMEYSKFKNIMSDRLGGNKA
jgi:hypothetical protein